jgi:hypothetical protein
LPELTKGNMAACGFFFETIARPASLIRYRHLIS